jgi:hypothetical protein
MFSVLKRNRSENHFASKRKKCGFSLVLHGKKQSKSEANKKLDEVKLSMNTKTIGIPVSQQGRQQQNGCETRWKTRNRRDVINSRTIATVERHTTT